MAQQGTRLAVLALLVSLVACATISGGSIDSEATADAFAKYRETKGVAVLSVNWGRRWKCGDFENAEILSLGFDRLPLKTNLGDTPPEVFLDGPSRLTKRPEFFNYALLLEPGEYALTSVDIKAARSVSDVGHFIAKRSELVKEGKAQAGSFTIDAGELVYIGHFFLDCHRTPILWRYYTDGRDAFEAYATAVKQKYPFLPTEKMRFRLFKTTTLGREYELPK